MLVTLFFNIHITHDYICYLSKNSIQFFRCHRIRRVSWIILVLWRNIWKLKNTWYHQHKCLLSYTLDIFTIIYVLSFLKPYLEARKAALFLKWVKTGISLNKMTSFTIAAKLFRVFLPVLHWWFWQHEFFFIYNITSSGQL